MWRRRRPVMKLSRLWQDTDFSILVVLALLGVLLHTLTNGQYGFHRDELAGHVKNRYGVLNEETTRHPDVFVCGQPREPWPAFWKQFRYYG
jgi:hypothetical protein